MEFNSEVGVFTRVTAAQTGVVTIGVAGKPSALYGVLAGANANGTAPTVQVWQGATTGAGTTLIGVMTLTRSAFTPMPAYLSGGATFYVSNCELPDLTIFWNPLGG